MVSNHLSLGGDPHQPYHLLTEAIAEMAPIVERIPHPQQGEIRRSLRHVIATLGKCHCQQFNKPEFDATVFDTLEEILNEWCRDGGRN